MKEAKPICVMYYLPDAIAGGSGQIPDIGKINDFMQAKFSDYHFLAVPSNQSADGSCEDVRIEVYHAKDFTESNYEELKQLILTQLEELKPPTK
jgi:hypothetical protein